MGSSGATRPDARKTLRVLRDEWSSCIRCDLGKRRIDFEGKLVFGMGTREGLMFIGEGPGVDEESQGEPFIGRSGQLLRRLLRTLGFNDYEGYYFTNLVTCRSCSPLQDTDGQPVFRRGKLVFKDEPPKPLEIAECLPRLYEEIYLVDPVVIVGLGAPVCKTLMQKHVTITRDRGETAHIAIPGATYRPVLTEKKQEWLRKVRGEWQMPIEQNEVLYHLIPTLHPAYVARNIRNLGADSPYRLLAADIKKAIKTYETYLETVFGALPQHREDPDIDKLQHQLIRGEEDA